MFDTLDGQCIDTLRFLAADMVQNANSGWPAAARSADGLRAVDAPPRAARRRLLSAD
ncbi:MAG: hypothetical protein H7306_06735 [Bacteriovorax sp.]|nr:hypothetical protein [Rhizobacter sp.]